MSNQPYLSIIIPSYNEMENIRRDVLEEIYVTAKSLNIDFEILFSDDGSTDGTLEKLRQFTEKKREVRLLENHHAGKAPAVTSGMLAARGKYRLFSDFDQSTPLSEVVPALGFLENGYNIVVGSREIKGARRDKEPWHRHLMGRGFNFFVQVLAVRGIHDSQCGFKLFDETATYALFPALHIYGSDKPRNDAFTGAFDVELLFLARKAKFKTKEMPVAWKHHHSDRVSPVRDSLRMFRDIVLIRIAWAMGKYKELKKL